ncbi:hypothetical protein RSA11_03840 [Exiguobacterium indicum]|uniref:ABC3 transporter permease C-terminal domain-containing protein n=1 Tax=Exiguobacterium indicum TaxID=296995 RepID=A0AAW3MIK4_9BACL|nr:ABC transporter permease [Exiguobacterium indicum]KTR27806.1 hypothetical protein RSA11_03840 [Exiguobacterium indicum]
MLRFVINHWRRQRGKFILTLIGALIISAGLSLMFNLTDSSQGTVEQTLQKKWSSAYDIVVRPKGSQLASESNDLLEPNYLNGIDGGISFKQYETIKKMKDIAIAAPVAVMGYVKLGLRVDEQWDVPDKPGFYRLRETLTSPNGFGEKILSDEAIYSVNANQNARVADIPGVFTTKSTSRIIYPRTFSLLVAIDPEAEAKLVGLDRSIIPSKENSRYFTKNDKATEKANPNTIPILLNPNSFNQGTFQYSIERLDVPFCTQKQQNTFYSKIPKDFTPAFKMLNEIPSKTIKKFTISSKDVEQKFFSTLTNTPTKNIQSSRLDNATIADYLQLEITTGPLTYRPEKSPYTTRWSNAYQVESQKIQVTNPFLKDINALPKTGYRSTHSLEKKVKDTMGSGNDIYYSPGFSMNVIGLYDSNKIRVSKDPLNELPMETYRPSSADLVLDANRKPVNPAKSINTSGDPVGLLTNSPNMLTTLDSAQQYRGNKSISSIRLKIKGGETLSEKSDQLLQQIKATIERDPGLVATITKGSSPQPAVTKVVEQGKTLGWIEQPWVHIGAAMTIFRETSVGFSSVIFAMLAVAIVYVLATSYVSMLARRKEFAVLLALGWRTKDLYKIVLIEAAILAGFVSTVALIVEGIFSYVRNEAMNGWSLLWIALFSLVIYLAGATWSAWTIRRISPYEAIKTGEYAKAARVGLKLRSTVTLVLKELIGKWKRNSLSVLSIALPTALLTFFLFVTFHLQGVLYTSWLGQFVALQVGPMHYVTMGVAITIAILTTGEIMWQNVTDRRASLAVLKALGWTNGAIRQLIVLEGFLVGLISGVIGLIIAYTTIYVLYDLVPWNEPLLIGVSLALPILFGVIAAFIPAQLAARVQPYQELKDAS